MMRLEHAGDHSCRDVLHGLDHRFFLGTVALLNSLRLTGNVGELVVLDAGLTAERTRNC